MRRFKISKQTKTILSLILMSIIIITMSGGVKLSAKANTESVEKINLTKQQEEKLYKLCKVWGFVKYYHPKVALGQLDWDEELFKILPEVLHSKDNNQTDKVIYKWINNLGVLENCEENSKNTEQVKLNANTGWIKDTQFISNYLSNLLLKIESTERTGKHYYIETDKFDVPVFKNEKMYEKMDYSDYKMKLLSLFRFWNIIEYFCPNRHIIDENWDSVLKEFIPKMVNGKGELEYTLNLFELVGKIQDGHSMVGKFSNEVSEFFGNKLPPFAIDFIEGKVVVTETIENVPNSNIKIGDVILKLDEKDMKDVIKEKAKYFPPTSTNYNNGILKYFLLRTNKDSINLTIERDGNIRVEKVVFSMEYFKAPKQREKKPSHSLKDNILYIAPGYLEKGEINNIMDKYVNTKGIIVDLRQYPSDDLTIRLPKYLMDKQVEFVKFSKVNLKKPGEFVFTNNSKIGSDNPEHYKGKVILLINEETVSHGEYTAMALRKAPKATVVGNNSAGADGNAVYFMLPGRVPISMSGIGVYYPDGTETQKIGIVPDVKVIQTIKGFREGRDEIIEKAIEIINQ